MSNNIDLSKVYSDYEAKDGDILTGTLGANVKISIADGATVTLNGVTINGTYHSDYSWAGLTCEGSATIILADGSTNIVKGFYSGYPGIYVPSGNTLIINGQTDGNGSLNASSSSNDVTGAGIGGGGDKTCGNIEIQGGVITATGGDRSAGIGSCETSSCGTITISGGTVTANGGDLAAGIGSSIGEGGYYSFCDNISITGGTVNATGGGYAAGIGTGYRGTCSDITISGGRVTATGGANGAGIGSGEGGRCSDITIAKTVTHVKANRGEDANFCIGAGKGGTCGTVTLGDMEMWVNGVYQQGNDYINQYFVEYYGN